MQLTLLGLYLLIYLIKSDPLTNCAADLQFCRASQIHWAGSCALYVEKLH